MRIQGDRKNIEGLMNELNELIQNRFSLQEGRQESSRPPSPPPQQSNDAGYGSSYGHIDWQQAAKESVSSFNRNQGRYNYLYSFL